MEVDLQKNLKARRRVQAQRAASAAEDADASEKMGRKVRERGKRARRKRLLAAI